MCIIFLQANYWKTFVFKASINCGPEIFEKIRVSRLNTASTDGILLAWNNLIGMRHYTETKFGMMEGNMIVSPSVHCLQFK